MKTKLLVAAAALALTVATAHADMLFTIPPSVSSGHMNVRNGPGANHGLIGAIPGGQTVSASRCVPRDDGVRGADWCLVTWNRLRGWVSQAGLMPMMEEPLQPVNTGSGPDLICGAPRVLLGDDPRDNNPVVSVEVTYNPDAHAWHIFHRRANGQVISRGEQYAITDWSDNRRSQWTGSLNRNRSLYMVGEVRQDEKTGQIGYLEWLYDRAKNNALVMQMGALCRVKGIDMEQSTPQPSSALSPVTVAPQQPRVVRDSVPIYLSNQGASVLVDVILGGQPARLMLDTGATTSLISRGIADVIVRSGNGSWQESKRFRMADGSVRTAPIVLIKDVRIGRHVVGDVEAGVSDSDEMLLAFPVVNGIAPFTINTRTRELIFDTSVARN